MTSPSAELTRPLEWAPPKVAISRMPYLPGLDGMRALAVVAVMVYHANSSWLPGGFLGVEVFFVISGYLITLLLIGEHERSGRIDLGQFWLRRARRLLPALFVMLIGLTIYTTLFRRDALGQLRGDVVGGLAYVSNWYQVWVGQGYTASGDFAPLRHLWSLGVEEQFYLLWPLAMVGLMLLGRRRLPDLSRWLFLAVIVITVGLAVAFHPGEIGPCNVTPDAYWNVGGRCISKLDALYLNTITRAGGLLLGAAFAMIWRPVALMRGPMRDKGGILDGVAIVGLGALAALYWYLHLVTPAGGDPLLFRGGLLWTGLATLAVMAAVTHRGSKAGPLLGGSVLLWIGTRSYGLYLYHWPVYQGIRRVAGVGLTLPQFLLAMAITVPITEASYRFVETPIRTGRVSVGWRRLQARRDPVPRRIIAGAGACVVALSVFAAANLATAELRQNEIAESLAQGAEENRNLDELLGAAAPTPNSLDAAAASAEQETDERGPPATDERGPQETDERGP
ncbi:MAG: acyltransferase, partial [Actinomycetota bacterium]|nr:acyltransferase [Actinomycetota bacterium]